ncbi:hypothetical protein WAI453_008381 [Rhynchosporium graminicola]|uniref:Rhodopsin domain-containing protein n=2 Tax=Rhynchosporium TaxID=38037 RepID=A0A1E1LVJ8_RHYSE|nr:uncharacterized protein RCO7_00442 [Rhynchosporium commune]CZT40886.1 uncharacterized protein RSE6_00557 [Rhynchosporium secalis]
MTIHTQGTIAIAVAFSFALLANIAIGARVYTQVVITKKFNLNDVGILIAYAAYLSLGGLLVNGVINGIGGHIFQASIPKITEVLKMIWFLEIIYVILTSVMKGSIAVTMMQWTKNRILIWMFWGSIAMDVIISSIFTFYVIFQCTPISYAWQMLDPKVKGKCLPFKGQLYMGLALCFVTLSLDILLMVSPFIMMKGRGINKHLKNYIYGIFSLGIFATIANLIRLAALFKLEKSTDQLFDAAPVFTWSAVEVSIGLVIAGLLELGPLMAKYNFKGFDDYSHFGHLGDDDTVKLQNIQSIDKPGLTISGPVRGF